jgi:hypothetical protein
MSLGHGFHETLKATDFADYTDMEGQMTRVLAVVVASALTANCATGAYNVRRDLGADNMTPSANGERNGASGAARASEASLSEGPEGTAAERRPRAPNSERNGASGAARASEASLSEGPEGTAAERRPRAPNQDPPGVTAAYVKAMAPGARIAVTMTDGKRMKGTLMMVQEDAIVVRPRTRVPEPAQTLPVAQIATIETEREGGGMGRAIAIGAAVGAGAAFGVFLALIAALSD